jgi:hypothetical protein
MGRNGFSSSNVTFTPWDLQTCFLGFGVLIVVLVCSVCTAGKMTRESGNCNGRRCVYDVVTRRPQEKQASDVGGWTLCCNSARVPPPLLLSLFTTLLLDLPVFYNAYKHVHNDTSSGGGSKSTECTWDAVIGVEEKSISGVQFGWLWQKTNSACRDWTNQFSCRSLCLLFSLGPSLNIPWIYVVCWALTLSASTE